MANSDILKLSEDGKTVIGVYDKSVKSITIPDGVTKIGNRAFYAYFSLQSIDIPDSVTEIGDWAFLGCSSLQSIDVSNDNIHFASVDGILFNKDLTAIVRFPQKYDVKEYVIPNSVTKIGNGAFSGCSSLQSIDIPDSVTEIGNGAFSGCSSLQCIDIPNRVTEIGVSAFGDCSSLQSIDIPDSVTKIGDSTFWCCRSLQSIDIPDSVTKIWDSAFSGCSSLQSIDIPDSITKIGWRAFDGCSSLQSIDVSNDNIHFASVDGILFNKDLTAIVRFPPKYDVTEYVIPNSVTVIGSCAFSGCSSLQSIDIPDSVTKIWGSAFSGCSSLEHIYLHCNDVEKLTLGEHIFQGVDFDKCILHIPSGTRWAYRHHDVFKRFKNIVTTGFNS